MTGWERLGSGGLTALHGVHPDFGYLRIRSLVLPVTSMLFSVILMR
jgi:hypothetical protein